MNGGRIPVAPAWFRQTAQAVRPFTWFPVSGKAVLLRPLGGRYSSKTNPPEIEMINNNHEDRGKDKTYNKKKDMRCPFAIAGAAS